MRGFKAGIACGVAGCGVLIIAASATAKNHGMFLGGLDPRPYYANVTFAGGTSQEHMFTGDGTTTHIEVKALGKIRCEFWHYDGTGMPGTKLKKKIDATQEGDQCAFSYKSKGSEQLDLACLTKSDAGADGICQVEIQSD